MSDTHARARKHQRETEAHMRGKLAGRGPAGSPSGRHPNETAPAQKARMKFHKHGNDPVAAD